MGKNNIPYISNDTHLEVDWRINCWIFRAAWCSLLRWEKVRLRCEELGVPSRLPDCLPSAGYGQYDVWIRDAAHPISFMYAYCASRCERPTHSSKFTQKLQDNRFATPDFYLLVSPVVVLDDKGSFLLFLLLFASSFVWPVCFLDAHCCLI